MENGPVSSLVYLLKVVIFNRYEHVYLLGMLSTYHFAGFPMVFQWFSYGFPMVFQWFSYGSNGFPMVFQWFSNGFPMVSYGFPMVFQWFSYGFSNGFPMVFQWFSYGCCRVLNPVPGNDFPGFAESPWTSCGTIFRKAA